MKHESLMYFTTSIDYLMYLLNDAYIISTCQNINIFQNNLPTVSKKNCLCACKDNSYSTYLNIHIFKDYMT